MSAIASDTSDSAPPVVRGSEKRLTDLMEAFQQSYLQGIAAAAGCVIVGVPSIDEGIDVVLSHRHSGHAGDEFVYLGIQMKASTEGTVENGKFVRTKLQQDRYNTYRNATPSMHRIVLILHLPESQDDWVAHSNEALMLHHRAYWVCIEGAPENTADSITVKAPVTQVFDDKALCEIMCKIGQGGGPNDK